MNGKKENDRTGEAVAGFLLFGVLAWLAIKVAPQALGLLIGALLGSASIMLGVVGVAELRSQGWAARLIGAGGLTIVSYLAVDGLIGADVQMRRFNRSWEAAGQDPTVLLDHPWAVVPPTLAAASTSDADRTVNLPVRRTGCRSGPPMGRRRV